MREGLSGGRGIPEVLLFRNSPEGVVPIAVIHLLLWIVYEGPLGSGGYQC